MYICTIWTCHLTASANVIRPDYSQHNEFRSMIHATGIMHRGTLHRTHRALTLYTGGHTTHRGINAHRRAVYFPEHRQLRIRRSHEGVPGGAKVHRLIVTKTINLSSSSSSSTSSLLSKSYQGHEKYSNGFAITLNIITS